MHVMQISATSSNRALHNQVEEAQRVAASFNRQMEESNSSQPRRCSPSSWHSTR